MTNYSVYDNFTGSYLTTVQANDELEAHTKGFHFGREQAYDKNEFMGVTIINHDDTK